MNTTSLELKTVDRKQIEWLLENAPERFKKRAKLILLYDDGLPTKTASMQVGYSSSQARYWKRQFLLKGMTIFPITDWPRISEGPIKDETQNLGLNQVSTADKISFKNLPQTTQPGMLPDDLMSEAGKKILLFHFTEMLKHEDGTLSGEEIEDLHDMRVATRRMRAAFNIFADSFDPKIIKPYLQGLKTTATSLGTVRDLDVFKEKIQLYVNSLPETQQEGLLPLMDDWNINLSSARSSLEQYLTSSLYINFKQSYLEFLLSPSTGVAKLKTGALAPSAVRFIAPTLIYSRFASIMAFDPIMVTATFTQLHALRIEFKKFRYTLEFFREILGGETQEIINEIKMLQDHLGELHDAYVATQTISRFLKKWDKHQERLSLSERKNPEIIVGYLAFRFAERYSLMVTFPLSWDQFKRPELRQKLANAVSKL
jgi:CHAD domain-containing protein